MVRRHNVFNKNDHQGAAQSPDVAFPVTAHFLSCRLPDLELGEGLLHPSMVRQISVCHEMLHPVLVQFGLGALSIATSWDR